jgi:hypothetical protein
MFSFILDLFWSFLLLGLLEAVIKPIAKYWVQRKIILLSPAVLAYLDDVFPFLLKDTTPVNLEAIVRSKFSELTREDWSDVNIDYFWEVYDPRVTVAKFKSLNDQV